MTQRRSTILDDIDFKLRLIKHFEKVHGKVDGATKLLMIEQSQRTYLEVRNMTSPTTIKAVGKLFVKYKLKDWMDFVLIRPPHVSPNGGPPIVNP